MGNSKYLSRDDILSSLGFRTREVEVPEWGGVVVVRELTSAEVDNNFFDAVNMDGTVSLSKLKGIAPRLVWIAAIDDAGERLFGKRDDLRALERMSYRALSPLARAVLELSGLAEEEGEDEEDGGDAEGNG